MITAEYLITGKYGELQRITGNGRIVRFKLGDEVSGTLCFGGRCKELTGGCCSLSTSGLLHGQYTPTLLMADGAVELEPLIVSGEQVAPAPTSEKMHRYALERLWALESDAKKLNERINELESSIKGTALFE